MATTRTPTRRNAASTGGAKRASESEPAKRDPKPATPAKKDPPAKAPARKEPPKSANAARAAVAPATRKRVAGQTAGKRGITQVKSKQATKQAAFIDPAGEPAAAIESAKAAQAENRKGEQTHTPGKAAASRATKRADGKAGPRRSAGKRRTQTRDTAPVLPDNIALVLQGGGALGAYQAGVYQGLFEAGIAPNWIAGISIGAFNTAIIAGNPPQRRMEALREFWDTISRPYLLPSTTFGQEARFADIDADSRAWLDTWEAWRAIVEGQHGFYQPRGWLGQDPMALFGAPPGPAEASFYDTSPMIATLERMVDFDRLNDGGIRVSVGAVNVRTGNLEYFDNTQMRLDARHILASGALPPAFPAVEIDGEFYWDGGLVSNTPLSQVLTASPRRDTLVFQVDLWNARGDLPQNLLDVAERQKEIQYSSRTRLITDTQRVFQHYRRLLRELLEEIPEDVRKSNPWAQHAAELACDRRYSVVHLIYRDRARIGHFKDYQFGRVAMREHWLSGQSDIARALSHPDWLQLPHGESAFVAHDATAP
jgi:NTE family protein